MEHLTPLEVISLYPQHRCTLPSLFETRARADPERPCVLFQETTWTWGIFHDVIASTVHALRRGLWTMTDAARRMTSPANSPFARAADGVLARRKHRIKRVDRLPATV